MKLSDNALKKFNQERITNGLPPIPTPFRRTYHTSITISPQAHEGLMILAKQFSEAIEHQTLLSSLLETIGTYQLLVSTPLDELDEYDNMNVSVYQDEGYDDAIEGVPRTQFFRTYVTRKARSYFAYMRGYMEGVSYRTQKR